MLRYVFLAAPLLAAVAFASPPSSRAADTRAGNASPERGKLSEAAVRGLAFAQQHCASCHAVGENGTSPNPESPPFQDIANRPGVTADTFEQFLRDSHNYPAAMNFAVEDGQIRDLADYIATLRKAGYRLVM